MRQQQAAPTAVWAEARGERSLGLARIPDLQLSLLPTLPSLSHEPLLLLRVVILQARVHGWEGVIL